MSERIVIEAEPRQVIGKQVSQLRREGWIPGVIYGRKEPVSVQMEQKALRRALRTVGKMCIRDRANVATGSQTILAESAGIWSFVHWSLSGAQLASLRATNPAAGQDSSYALWLADSDGSDARRLFPPEGESGAFARLQPLAWGPDADRLAFILSLIHI